VAQQCLTGLVNPFAAMAPDWANWSSSSCSSLAAADGSLVLTQHEPCSAASPNAIAGLAPPNVMCGDFDVQVDFAVTGLVAGVTGGIFASMRAHDLTVTTNGMTIERYAAEHPIPSSQSYQNYKSYTANLGDDATSVFVPTTDVTGRLRLTRAGTTVKSYYWKAGTPDGQWVLVNTATLSSTPWTLVLYEGDNSAANKGPAPYSVTFSNLLISGSASDPSATAVVIDAGAADAPIGKDVPIALDTAQIDSGAKATGDGSVACVEGGVYTWYTYNGMQYAITQNYNSWLGAETEAISQGGHLTTLTDANQVSWILDTFPNIYMQGSTDWGAAFFWIGLHNTSGNLTSPSDWAWSSGSTSTYWQSITLKLWGWNQNYPLGDPATGQGPDSPYAYFHTVPHQAAGTINDQAIYGNSNSNIVLGLMERSACP
jgi:hypothetical protein